MNTFTQIHHERWIAAPYLLSCKLRNAFMQLAPIADLALRLWVAKVFFDSGLVKIQSWDTTVLLFTYEYSVPLLAPELAAYIGAFTELTFPVLLTLGLMGRFSAGVLFVFNIIAVISYPELNEVAIDQHKVWGLMLLMLLAHGPGSLSLDHWIDRMLLKKNSAKG